jgi:hypothetical protein
MGTGVVQIRDQWQMLEDKSPLRGHQAFDTVLAFAHRYQE